MIDFDMLKIACAIIVSSSLPMLLSGLIKPKKLYLLLFMASISFLLIANGAVIGLLAFNDPLALFVVANQTTLMGIFLFWKVAIKVKTNRQLQDES